MWIQISEVTFGDITQEQELWLESQTEGGFVAIEDGDWSVIHKISQEPKTLEYVMTEYEQEFIIVDKESPDAVTLREKGYTECKGYFSNQSVFSK